MELVADANVLFAAFIKDGTTRRLLLTQTPYPLKLYTTPFILEETYKHRKLLAEKTGLDESMVVELVLELISASGIEIIKKEELRRFKNESERISPRRDDAQYFAVALYKNCKIWSNDKPLAKQSRIGVVSTAELLEIL